MLSFSERMEQAKELAQVSRNRGKHTGKSASGWNRKRQLGYDANSWEWLCEQTRREWRRQCLELQNQFSAACLNGPEWQEDLKWL